MPIYGYNSLLYEGANVVCHELSHSPKFNCVLNKKKKYLFFCYSSGFFSYFHSFVYLFKLPIHYRDLFLFYDKNEYNDADLIYRFLVILLVIRWFIRYPRFYRFRKIGKKQFTLFLHPFLCLNYFFFRRRIDLKSRFFYRSFTRYWFKIFRKTLFSFLNISANNLIALMPYQDRRCYNKRKNMRVSYDKYKDNKIRFYF